MTSASGPAASEATPPDKDSMAAAARAELKRRGKSDAEIKAGKQRARNAGRGS